MTYAKNRDANEPEIVKALEGVGATVQRLSECGLPDLLVGYRGATFLLEVKREGKNGGRRHYGGLDERGLNEQQQKWWAKWNGAQPVIVTNPQEALCALGRHGAVAADDCTHCGANLRGYSL